LLGVSNVSLPQLDELVRSAKVKLRFVQNRCYAERGWDRKVREYCAANGIVYQGFSLLTANRGVVGHPTVAQLAAKYRRTSAQIVFRFCLAVGMVVLTGTTNPAHMREDLAAGDFELSPDEAAVLGRLADR
jgi:diketogulonate reductase-like aldo/keto reductase